MHFFIFHILIGSAIAYMMQSQIRWVAERITSIWLLQVIIKIFLDALMAVSWIVVAPLILFARFQMKNTEEDNDGSDKS